MGASHFLPPLVGPAKATEILLTAQTLTAQQAHDVGLVTQLAPPTSPNEKEEEVELCPTLTTALEFAHTLTQQHPVALRSMVQTLRDSQNKGLDQALRREAYAQAVCYARMDWGEGLEAVVEKCSPQFGEYWER